MISLTLEYEMNRYVGEEIERDHCKQLLKYVDSDLRQIVGSNNRKERMYFSLVTLPKLKN